MDVGFDFGFEGGGVGHGNTMASANPQQPDSRPLQQSEPEIHLQKEHKGDELTSLLVVSIKLVEDSVTIEVFFGTIGIVRV